MSTGYRKRTAHGYRWLEHRLVYIDHCQCPLRPTDEVDHIDRDRKHNHPRNLRRLTRAQNHQNKLVQARNPTGIKGVHRSRYQFEARIGVEGRQYRLGRFETPEEAGAMYQLYQELLHPYRPQLAS